eukprot:6205597-Pleurochrysis_carterae.AAC.2
MAGSRRFRGCWPSAKKGEVRNASLRLSFRFGGAFTPLHLTTSVHSMRKRADELGFGRCVSRKAARREPLVVSAYPTPYPSLNTAGEYNGRRGRCRRWERVQSGYGATPSSSLVKNVSMLHACRCGQARGKAASAARANMRANASKCAQFVQ